MTYMYSLVYGNIYVPRWIYISVNNNLEVGTEDSNVTQQKNPP